MLMKTRCVLALPQSCCCHIAYIPTAWGSDCRSPPTQPSSALASHSFFPFMNAKEMQARMHQPSEHTLTHTCSCTPTHTAVNSDALARQYYEGAAEGSLTELESRCYSRLAARACNSVSRHFLASFLCSANWSWSARFFLLMTTLLINCIRKIRHHSGFSFFPRSMQRSQTQSYECL